MKKFVLKIILIFLIVGILSVVLAYTVDPFNVFHVTNIRDNGCEPNKNYIKMRFVLDNSDNFDAYLFGSSRVGSIHVEKMDSNCYNMTYSAGVPSEHLKNINTFLSHQIIPDTIYIGLDSWAYTFFEEEHYFQPLRMPYEYIITHREEFYSTYLNPALSVKALPTILSREFRQEAENNDVFYSYGWWCDYDHKTIDWTQKVEPSIGITSDYEKNISEALKVISEIKELCDANGIDVIFFTNPMYRITYEASVDAGYYDFLEGLAQITDYYNFSGLNDVTVNNGYYIDTSHYNAYVGDMIIDSICYDKTEEKLLSEGFGAYVTRDNVDTIIDTLKSNDLKMIE